MAVICSHCQVAAVHQHCATHNTDCTWLRCHACGTLFDWRTDKAVDRDGTPLTLDGG